MLKDEDVAISSAVQEDNREGAERMLVPAKDPSSAKHLKASWWKRD